MCPKSETTPSVTFSVLIGMVSTEDDDRILETLDELRRQEGDATYEVIIGDRRDDEIGRRIDAGYPEVRRIPAPAGTDLPTLRTLALDEASGEFIVVTEDHCVPSRTWLASIRKAFRDAPEGTVAVGGCVDNGVTERALDWATFLCEYSYFLEPVAEGVGPVLPGMNVAYRHTALEGVDRSLLTSGFWETTVHPVLLKNGDRLYSTNAIKLFHCKKFSFGLFFRQRYIYSRYYAGLRFGSKQLPKRIVATVASVILPPLLLLRMRKQIATKNCSSKLFWRAVPSLSVFVVVWAWGEMVGYVLGAGNALQRIE